MITKEIILKGLKKETAIGNIALMNVLTFDEYCKLTEAADVVDVWGDFDLVVMFSDHPDYLFVQKNQDVENLQFEIKNWVKEINI
ncbi:hypothetical protein SAMN05443429_11210 [Cruoricaptor ignavus]|uniref:Uncharacterized protein n=1 Tax=Cruoricaptor ignavus TaxID=1118202 RepID=A0A1M6HC74_9FLAO|nr:hypothetical protein [Cruoricaptor ignavus]SHJ19792.1 hypothetical protein SAMN05443429_11210 [Cruoricaptor ignavus]